jgi:hypothetical protein
MPDSIGKTYTFTVTVNPYTTAQGGFASPEDVKAAMQAGLVTASIPAVVNGNNSELTAIPKVKWFTEISADQTVAFDGSTVVPADAATTILNALQQDPEWAGATGLTVTVRQK